MLEISYLANGDLSSQGPISNNRLLARKADNTQTYKERGIQERVMLGEVVGTHADGDNAEMSDWSLGRSAQVADHLRDQILLLP